EVGQAFVGAQGARDAGFVLSERRWIDDDDIESLPGCGEVCHDLEGIATAGVVTAAPHRLHPVVVAEVSPRRFQGWAADVDAEDRLGPARGSGEREAATGAEDVQHACASACRTDHATVVALIEEVAGLL